MMAATRHSMWLFNLNHYKSFVWQFRLYSFRIVLHKLYFTHCWCYPAIALKLVLIKGVKETSVMDIIQFIFIALASCRVTEQNSNIISSDVRDGVNKTIRTDGCISYLQTIWVLFWTFWYCNILAIYCIFVRYKNN